MKAKVARFLDAKFVLADALHPDKSTEFVLEIAAQLASEESGKHYDCGDVAEALHLMEHNK